MYRDGIYIPYYHNNNPIMLPLDIENEVGFLKALRDDSIIRWRYEEIIDDIHLPYQTLPMLLDTKQNLNSENEKSF